MDVVLLGQWSDYEKSEDKFMLMHFSVAIFSDIVEDGDHGAELMKEKIVRRWE